MSTASITGAYLEELTGFEPAITVLQTDSLTTWIQLHQKDG